MLLCFVKNFILIQNTEKKDWIGVANMIALFIDEKKESSRDFKMQF